MFTLSHVQQGHLRQQLQWGREDLLLKQWYPQGGSTLFNEFPELQKEFIICYKSTMHMHVSTGSLPTVYNMGVS